MRNSQVLLAHDCLGAGTERLLERHYWRGVPRQRRRRRDQFHCASRWRRDRHGRYFHPGWSDGRALEHAGYGSQRLARQARRCDRRCGQLVAARSVSGGWAALGGATGQAE